MRHWLMLLSLLCSIGPSARADVQGLTLLDAVQSESRAFRSLEPPILGDDGAAYWSAYFSDEPGYWRLESESGTLASETRTVIEAGDFPLSGRPTDARGPVVLLSGSYYVHAPAAPGGFEGTGAIYSYPGLSRLVYFGSTFPGFTSDPVGLQVWSHAFLDADNSVVFQMQRATIVPEFTYAICRATGGAIAILVQTGVTVVPGGDGGAFTVLRNPIVDGGVILFYGKGGGRRGVYQLVGGVISIVVDDQTTLPGNSSPTFITDHGNVLFANDGLDVALVAFGGVWKRIDGQWSRIVAHGEPIPNGTGEFGSFRSPAIRDGKVVFHGGPYNHYGYTTGIYADAFGGVTRVVDLSTPFVHDFPRDFIVAEGGRWFDGTDIAFAVQGSESGIGLDGLWRAIYRTTLVPEPARALASATAFAALAAIRRRRSHVS